ncbi:unnamed protein product [Pleuronectes platessa]|uniref:Uncharacterized protein n=1 Tax=Pleuronectes platessa TaxID=8262 RepID=A0A9N7VI40_PLEPL|nr:unnamed protein product [Pleuronectes platessa]
MEVLYSCEPSGAHIHSVFSTLHLSSYPHRSLEPRLLRTRTELSILRLRSEYFCAASPPIVTPQLCRIGYKLNLQFEVCCFGHWCDSDEPVEKYHLLPHGITFTLLHSGLSGVSSAHPQSCPPLLAPPVAHSHSADANNLAKRAPDFSRPQDASSDRWMQLNHPNMLSTS